MNRFFRAPHETLDAVRMQVIEALDQPNGRADQPWQLGGDFQDDGFSYLALGEHHTTGPFAPLVAQFLTVPGVEEIQPEAYAAAAPEQPHP